MKKIIANFLIKHHNVFLIIFIPLISALIASVALLLFKHIRMNSLFWLLLYYVVLIVILYIFFIKKGLSEKINKHQTFLTILGVLIPVVLFSWQQTIYEKKQIDENQIRLDEDRTQLIKYEVSLAEENNRNNSHLASIIADLKNNSNTIFWRDFSLDAYKQYWEYIHLTKSQDCKNKYAELTISLGVLNNINKMRQQLILIPNSFYLEMLKNASSTKPILDFIIGNCQLK
jgi:hypothetical protein